MKNKKEINSTIEEGVFSVSGKALMKRKLNKLYKKSDLANFDKSGIDTKGKTPDEVRQTKSDYYHDNMNKAARAKKAIGRLSRNKKEEVQEDAPANSVGQGGVDMNPTGGPARLKKSPMTRFEPAFDKRHKNKKLLLTKFRQHAYGESK
tara:strand:- start:8312 stop:8758 length:447 start_codon:yes stop_codon:yes gene_type:complete